MYMKVKVIKKHDGDGAFPTFEKGTAVTMAAEEAPHFLGWYACDIAGHETYVPESFVCDGVLTRDYNPTELIQAADDVVEVREIVNAWLLATNSDGVTGWIPAEAVVSLNSSDAGYPIDMSKPWYHGSNIEFDVLREGSTITQWKELAEAFATKPTQLSYDEILSPISHNGTEPGLLYIIDEPLEIGVDIYQHPRTTMDQGVEFLTKRELNLKRIL